MMTSQTLAAGEQKSHARAAAGADPPKFSEFGSLYIYICVCVCVSTRTAVTPFRSIAAMASSFVLRESTEEQQQASSIFYYLGDKLPILRVQSRGRHILIPHPWEWLPHGRNKPSVNVGRRHCKGQQRANYTFHKSLWDWDPSLRQNCHFSCECLPTCLLQVQAQRVLNFMRIRSFTHNMYIIYMFTIFMGSMCKKRVRNAVCTLMYVNMSIYGYLDTYIYIYKFFLALKWRAAKVLLTWARHQRNWWDVSWQQYTWGGWG